MVVAVLASVAAVSAGPVATAAAESYQALVSSTTGLTQIDTGSNTAASPVAGTGTLGPVVIAPDGQTAYAVTSDTGHGEYGVIPFALTASGPAAETPISVPKSDYPEANPINDGFDSIVITPNGHTLYIADGGNDVVFPIDLTQNPPVVGTAIQLNGGPTALAMSPDGSTVYALDAGITPIDTATNTAGTTVATSLGGNAESFALTPDGSKAYVPITGSPYVYPVSLPSGTKGTAINLGAETTGGDGIHTIAISPDGSTAYAAGAVQSDGDPSIVPINLANGQAGTPIDLTTPTGSDEASMFAVAITPDGKTVYASFESFSDGVVPIPTATDTPGTAITTGIGSEDWAIAITPDQPPVASFTVTAAPPGSATMFDASSSTVQFGSITSYQWNFGDGSPVVNTATPTTSHVYATAGDYTATLTETDGVTSASTTRTIIIGGGPAPIVSLAENTLDFGQLAAGASIARTIRITNTGAGPLVISSSKLSGADASDFTVSNDSCTGQTIDAGHDCAAQITFAPSEPGTRTATLAFTDNASGSPHTVRLTGTGAALPTLTGTVTDGTQSSAPPIAGASVRACVDVALGSSCKYTTTDSQGRYSFALAPNVYDLEVFPASGNLASGAALVTVKYAADTQDFSLEAPAAIPAGVTLSSGGGTFTGGVPRIYNSDPISITEKWHIPTDIGPAPAGLAANTDRIEIYTTIGAITPSGAGGEQDALRAGAAIIGVQYDSAGNVVHISPVFTGPGQFEGDPGAAADLRGRTVAVAGIAAACGPGLFANSNGGITITFKGSDGQVSFEFNPIAVNVPAPNGNNAGDVIVALAANAALSSIPEVNAYNAIVSAGNIGSQLGQALSNSNGPQAAAAITNLAATYVSSPLAPFHGTNGFLVNYITGGTQWALNSSIPPPAPCQSPPNPKINSPWGVNPLTPPFNFYTDPSGLVESTAGVPLEGARVVLKRSTTRKGRLSQVPNGSRTMSSANRKNPSLTDVDGLFDWDVLPGYYEITASDGHCRAPVSTSVFGVPPPVTNIKLRLRCKAIRRKATRTALKATVVTAGHAAVLVASVSARRGPQPTGIVTFKDGSKVVASAPIDAKTGRAVASETINGAHHSFSATYAGDAVDAPSSGR